MHVLLFQFSSVPWLIRSWEGHDRRFSRDLLPVFLQKATVRSSGKGRDVHPLMLSIQHFLCQPWCCPPSKVPWRMGFEKLLWPATCPNHANFCLLTVARRGSFGPTRKMILLRISHWSCAPSRRCREVFSSTWFEKPGSVGSMFHSHEGEWGWQETCTTWTCLQSWWCCSARSCLLWPLLPLLRQFERGLLLTSITVYQ